MIKDRVVCIIHKLQNCLYDQKLTKPLINEQQNKFESHNWVLIYNILNEKLKDVLLLDFSYKKLFSYTFIAKDVNLMHD